MSAPHLQAGAGAAWRGGTSPGLPRAAQQLQTANILYMVSQPLYLVHQKWISTLSTTLLGHILCYLWPDGGQVRQVEVREGE